MRSLSAIAVAVAFCFTAAYAENRVVTFANNTAVVVDKIFGSSTGAETCEEDILGEDVLSPGEAIDINFDDGSGSCQFDFKVTFADGDDGVLADISVCKVENVSIK